MLKPAQDRLDYGSLLSPPPDYTTTFALGATYSLDLEALVGIPMALFMSDEMSSSLTSNPIATLEGIRRSVDNFAIICEPGQVKVPRNHSVVFSLLENSVFEASLPDECSFHPKIWLIRYQNQAKDPLYRVIVLSRNLTFDRSWDIAVCLEGSKQKQKTEKNVPLQDFVNSFFPWINNPKKRNRIREMLTELDYIHFDTQDQNVTDFSFCPLGINGYGKSSVKLFESYKDLLVISPFISKTVVEELGNKALSNSTRTLITRRDEIAKLTPDLLNSFDVFAMKEAVNRGEEILSGDNPQESEYQNQDIHAKFYVHSKAGRHSFFIGSANCSHRAFNGNAEFLLKLDYRKYGFKLQNILADIFGDNEQENPFERVENLPEYKPEETSLNDKLEKDIKNICRSRPRANVVPNGDRYNVQLEIKMTKIPSGIDLKISSLGGGQQEKLTYFTVLKDLKIEQISQFYVIEAVMDDISVKRVVKISTCGIPEERDKAIFKTIIKDPSTFLKYMTFLLSDSPLVTTLEQIDTERLSDGKSSGRFLSTHALYENMLKTVSREPERLKEINRVMNFIDPDIVPEDFKGLHEIFMQASKKVK